MLFFGHDDLIHDRDPLFTEALVAILRTSGVASVKTPAKSPNCNPYAERFVKTIGYECLNHFVFFGERHLRHVILEFVEHYVGERFHLGIDGQLVKARAGFANDNGTDGPIVCRSRLGSLFNYYHREAASGARICPTSPEHVLGRSQLQRLSDVRLRQGEIRA